MKYNFDEIIERRGTSSVKWDEAKEEGIIPMWVADMDFKTAPAIINALKKRVDHGVFGYTLVPNSYYAAIINWFARRHQWDIQRSWIIYTSGVIPALSCCLKAITLPGEKVLVQTPVYNCFFSSIKNNGCEVIENELIRKDNTYEIDFEDFERKCADEKTSTFILCNPHNPAGRVWTKEELERMNNICMKHHVMVIADEIHCELVMPGHHYIPFASISEACQGNSITLNSPTKAFNLAGLQIANIICPDAQLRRRIDRAVNINEVCDVNPFGVIALQAAYNECEDWLDELNQYLWGNYMALKAFFEKELPQVRITKLEGTYLVWADILPFELTSDEAYAQLMRDGKVYVNPGTIYGKKAGQGYLRINIACPRATMTEGLRRIARVLSQYIDEQDTGCPM